MHPSVAKNREFLHQIYYSTGFTLASQIALIAVQFPEHAQDNFSAISFANADLAFQGSENIALAEGAQGTPSSQNVAANETTISFTAGACHEVVVLPNCYVVV